MTYDPSPGNKTKIHLGIPYIYFIASTIYAPSPHAPETIFERHVRKGTLTS